MQVIHVVKYKHLRRINITAARGGMRPRYFLYGENQPLHIIEHFYGFLISKGDSYSDNTIMRYLPAVAHFIDYLHEFGVLRGITNPAELASLLSGYQLLCQGNIAHSDSLQGWKEDIKFPAYAKNTLLPVFSALNIFLKFIEAEAETDSYATEELGAEYTSNSPVKIITSFKHPSKRGIHEKNKILQVSWLAGCIRSWRFVEKNKEVSLFVAKREKNTKPIKDLSFPIGILPIIDSDNDSRPKTYFESLLEHTKSYRDKLIFILMAWAGLRTHECLSILIIDIYPDADPKEGRIKIISPKGRKEAQIAKHPLPWKGRENPMANMPPYWEGIFFKILTKYLEIEYDYNSGHNFLFQALKGKNKGKPLALSQRQITKNLKNTIKRARDKGDLIPGRINNPDYLWCDHSMRHHYGNWMINFQPIGIDNNGNILRGFSIEEVQKLLGHRDIKITKLYANHDTEKLISIMSSVDFLWNSSCILDKKLLEVVS